MEIWQLLAEAGYHHAFIDGAIDMHGIALTRGEKKEREPVEDFRADCVPCQSNAKHYVHRVKANE